jgi:adenylate cyclase
MRRRRRAAGLAPLAAVGVAVAALALLAFALGAFSRLEGDSVDLRFQLRHKQPAHEMVVVAIDDVTFGDLRVQWPFPRSLHARAIDRLRAAGARQIAYDVQFTEPTKPREDQALLDAARRAGNVVFATTEVDDQGHTAVMGGDDVLARNKAVAANANLPGAAGGVFRRLPYAIEGLKTFAVVTADRAAGHRSKQASMAKGEAWIDYAGPPGTIRTVSFSQLVRGQVDPKVFRGKIVVVGATAPTLQDVHPTPTSGSALMAGPEIQANAIATARRGFPLHGTPGWLDVLMIVLLAIAAPLASLRLTTLRSTLVAAVLLVAYAAACKFAFDANLILPVVYPMVALVAATAGMVTVNFVAERRERERTRSLFGRFVGEPVVEELLDRTNGEARLGGVLQEATVMFSDLRGFTKLAERLHVEQVIDVLNRYLSEMSEAILDHGGTLVCYMGDGIMAVFGSPIEREEHADMALAAAREMVGERLDRFNDWLRAEGLGEGFRMGVGLNSGPVLSGHVGSERRLEYAAIGDTTNVASRLEGMTKGTGHQLFIAASTRRALRHPAADLVELGALDIAGRDAPIEVWTLGDGHPAASGNGAAALSGATAASPPV